MQQKAVISCQHNHKSNLELPEVNQPFGFWTPKTQNKKREKRKTTALENEKQYLIRSAFNSDMYIN